VQSVLRADDGPKKECCAHKDCRDSKLVRKRILQQDLPAARLRLENGEVYPSGAGHRVDKTRVPPVVRKAMNYTQLFRTLREAKGLTHDGLARLVGCHRNTVINVESGRPVKFRTVAELMEKMGYDAESSEMKSIALLWLESISGINLTLDRSTAEARKKIAKYRATEKEAAQMLADAVVADHLSVEQIQTLVFASSRPDVITILEGIRDLVRRDEPHPASEDVPALQVAEGN
jgi:DNA-binding XRE family transcriptional regulator